MWCKIGFAAAAAAVATTSTKLQFCVSFCANRIMLYVHMHHSFGSVCVQLRYGPKGFFLICKYKQNKNHVNQNAEWKKTRTHTRR